MRPARATGTAQTIVLLSRSLSPPCSCAVADVAHGRAPLVAPRSELFVPLGEQINALHHVRVRHQPLRWQPRTGELSEVHLILMLLLFIYFFPNILFLSQILFEERAENSARRVFVKSVMTI